MNVAVPYTETYTVLGVLFPVLTKELIMLGNRWIVVSVALVVAACGGKAVVADDGGEAGGGGSSVAGSAGGSGGSHVGGSGGSPVGGSGGGPGGVGGGPGGSGGGPGGVGGGPGGSGGGPGGAGGGPTCVETHERFQFRAHFPDGDFVGCSGGQVKDQHRHFIGKIVSSSGTQLVVDTCPPNAYCTPELVKIRLDSPGLDMYIRPETFVSVDLRVQMPWACTQRILVRNVDQWDGQPNPSGAGDHVYLAAEDGQITKDPSWPFSFKLYAQHCYPSTTPSCSGTTPDDYALGMSQRGQSQKVVVGMGQTMGFSFKSSTGEQWQMRGRNLRTFYTGACDADFEWGYWITQELYDYAQD